MTYASRRDKHLRTPPDRRTVPSLPGGEVSPPPSSPLPGSHRRESGVYSGVAEVSALGGSQKSTLGRGSLYPRRESGVYSGSQKSLPQEGARSVLWVTEVSTLGGNQECTLGRGSLCPRREPGVYSGVAEVSPLGGSQESTLGRGSLYPTLGHGSLYPINYILHRLPESVRTTTCVPPDRGKI